MSAAAASLPSEVPARDFPQRSASAGYYRVPNALAENLDLFAPSELALALIVCRWGNGHTVDDKTWSRYTGLKPKMKQHAIRGLKEKGLQCRGRGEAAKFYWDKDWSGLRDWIQTKPRGRRVRTAGRSKSVTPKLGQRIHPECRERGCNKLCEPETPAKPNGVLQIDPAVQHSNGKPVSNPTAKPDPANRKPVSNSTSPKPPPSPPPKYPLALTATRRYFPDIEPDFAEKLGAKCAGKVHGFDDAQLAVAVHAAHKASQDVEGLFLLTVPEKLSAVVAGKTLKFNNKDNEAWLASQRVVRPSVSTEPIRAGLTRIADALSKQDMPDLAAQVAEMKELHILDGQDIQHLDDWLQRLEAKVLERLKTRPLPDVAAEIAKELKPYRGKMSAEQIARLERQSLERKILEAAGIPGLSTFYMA